MPNHMDDNVSNFVNAICERPAGRKFQLVWIANTPEDAKPEFLMSSTLHVKTSCYHLDKLTTTLFGSSDKAEKEFVCGGYEFKAKMAKYNNSRSPVVICISATSPEGRKSLNAWFGATEDPPSVTIAVCEPAYAELGGDSTYKELRNQADVSARRRLEAIWA